MSRENLKNLTKVFVIFMIYLIYNGVFHALFELLNIQNSIITMFAGDVCFLVFMIILYWKKIKQNLHFPIDFNKIKVYNKYCERG